MNDKEKLDAFIDENREGMIALQRLLTSIPAISPSSGGVGELDKAVALSGWLETNGLGPVTRFDAPDARAKGGVRPNLVVTIPGNSPEVLWIMTHMDVVPPGEESLWKSPPFELQVLPDRIVGRGVEDNQQGLVGSIFAVLGLLRLGIVPARTVKLLFVADEEFGSDYGVRWLLENTDLFKPTDTALAPDGGEPDASMIVVAEKGLLWLKFIVKGVQCHGSRPQLGRNTLLAAADLILRLHALEKVFPETNPIFDPPTSTFSPTKKEANVPNINTIPGEDVFYLDCRVLPSISLDTVLEKVDEAMRAVETIHGVTIARETAQRVESPATPNDAPIVCAIQKAAAEVYGAKALPRGIGGGTVAAFLRRKGIPSAVWAKVGEQAHTPNEYCLLDNLAGDAKVMIRIMLDLR